MEADRKGTVGASVTRYGWQELVFLRNIDHPIGVRWRSLNTEVARYFSSITGSVIFKLNHLAFS